MNLPRLDPHDLVTPAARATIQALAAGGGTVRFVGGRVRDLLLDLPPGDVDLAVDLPPEESKTLLEEAGFGVGTIGIRYGTVIAIPERGTGIEVTSLRRDIKTDGRHPEVTFGTDWTEDAKRRDFTINALYADPDGTLLDPLDGIGDLRARKVRFIGDPEVRIREDYLRILRFFRFQAQFGEGEADAVALAACAAGRSGIARLSSERITIETRHLLTARDPSRALSAAHATGVLGTVLADPEPAPVAELVTLEQEHNVPPNWLRRWVLVDRAPEKAVGKTLVLSRREADGLRILQQVVASGDTPLALGYRFGGQPARDAILVRAARRGEGGIGTDLEAAERGSHARLPVSANDLLAAGIPEGPEVGEGLRRAEQAWLEGDLAPGRGDLLAAACGKGR